MQWRLILTLVLMVVVVIFSLANATAVPFSYLFGKKEISLALIIILSALTGAIAGVVASLSSQIQLRRKLQERERFIRDLQRQKGELAEEMEVKEEIFPKRRGDKNQK